MLKTEERKIKVITLCGSVRFEKEFWDAVEDLMKDGYIVLMPRTFLNKNEKATIKKEEMEEFVSIHKRKINLSDAIMVINKDGYIGEHTKSEIEYAKKNNKKVFYRYVRCKRDCYCIHNCIAKDNQPNFVRKISSSIYPMCPHYAVEDKTLF